MPRFVLFALLLVVSLSTFSQPCLEYKSGLCLRCAPNYSLLNDSCIQKIPGCTKYLNASICLQCEKTLFILNNGQCLLLNSSHDGIRQANLTLYQLAAFGDYIEIPLEVVREDTGFVQCDSMLRRGEYSHFISQTTQPLFFVAYSQLQGWRNYQIIYEASGGGLLLCLMSWEIKIGATIKSIVSIGRSQMVEHCLSYTASQECNYCQQGYHLDKGVCRADIAGCKSYYGNLCLACQGPMLLIENRCVSDCGSLCDTAKIPFFQGRFSCFS